jgi:hypothetical protein
LQADSSWDGPAGNGEEWGQKVTNGLWELWSYNDSSEGVEDWEEGSYTALWIQYEPSNGDYIAIKGKIDIEVLGASHLVSGVLLGLLLYTF